MAEPDDVCRTLHESGRSADAGGKYPDTRLATRLRLVARMLRSGSAARVYCVSQPGYDTHAVQPDRHAGLLREFVGAPKAFLDDFAAAGLGERVVLLAFSEFGRRAAEHLSYRTDHGTAGPVLLAGESVAGGLLSDVPRLDDLDGGDVNRSIDFRRAYATLLAGWLGIPAGPVLGGDFEALPLIRS